MSNAKTPMFYQPFFGNDNFYAPEVIDISAFTAPVAEAAVPVAPTAAKTAEQK